MINKVSRPLRPIVSRQRRLSGVSVPEPRQDGLGGDDLFIYFTVEEAAVLERFIYLFMLFYFFSRDKSSDQTPCCSAACGISAAV